MFHVDKLVGRVTNQPEVRHIGQNNTPLKELNVAVNHRRKNRDSGEYEDTGDTTWVTIKLWADRSEEDYVKGDLIEFAGSLVEKHFARRGETEETATGRRLESDWIDSLEIKFPSRDRDNAGDDGFTPASDDSDGWG